MIETSAILGLFRSTPVGEIAAHKAKIEARAAKLKPGRQRDILQHRIEELENAARINNGFRNREAYNTCSSGFLGPRHAGLPRLYLGTDGHVQYRVDLQCQTRPRLSSKPNSLWTVTTSSSGSWIEKSRLSGIPSKPVTADRAP